MVFPFSSKKKQKRPDRAYIPVNLVQRYASQGMPEKEIFSRWRSQGFAPGQADAAIRTVLRQRVAGPQRRELAPRQEMSREQFPTMQMTPTGAPAPMPPRREPMQAPPQRFEAPPQRAPQQVQAPQQIQYSRPEPTKFTFESSENLLQPELENVTLEEIIEGIVAEKWQEFEGRLSNFEERDLQLQEQIQNMRQTMKEVEKLVESKEVTLTGRFEEFGGNMEEIQGRIGSIEKVFKEFVPDLTRSVKMLSDRLEK